MKIDGRMFWLRIDSLLLQEKSTLTDMCKALDISYNTINTQRKNSALPKIEQFAGMSVYLHKPMEYLLFGKEEETICEEAQAVQNDSDLQALVRSIQRDRSLLSIVAVFIRSYENENIG